MEHFPTGGDYFERIDVTDDGLAREGMAVGVGGERAAHGEAVKPALLLNDGPSFGLVLLRFEVVSQYLGPLGAAFDFDPSFLLIEIDDSIHGGGIDEDCVGTELLGAGGVPRATNGDRLSGAPAARNWARVSSTVRGETIWET